MPLEEGLVRTDGLDSMDDLARHEGLDTVHQQHGIAMR